MRSLLYSLLSLATVATTFAAEVPAETSASKSKDEASELKPDTIFNGVTVPAMRELEGDSLDQDISHGNWVVEFFSPYCGHCKRFAPTLQTLYEFYYTSKPIATKQENDEDSLNSFTRYYDFKFAKINCVAYSDACTAKGVTSYPTVVYFKDGKEVKKEIGDNDLAYMSKWMEEILESIRPGTRTKGGPKLPKVGAHSVETGPETQDEAKEKEEAVLSTTSPSSTEPAEPSWVEIARVTATPNPIGVSEQLTAEKFQKLVTNTLDPWFVKFYAPWCHHCQALQPNWAQMAREMKGKLNIGEVNCDVEKRLCKDAHVQGYPTLLFFRGGERVEYNGLRGIGDLLDFAEKSVDTASGVPDVDLESFKKLEETEEVIFVYLYDHATTTEDFQALERLTLSMIGHAKLVKTKDPKMSERFKISTWPRLAVSRDGKPSYYPPIAPKDMRDSRKILSWMKSVWLPIVPELTSSNAREIMDGKIVVLAILSRERRQQFDDARRELKNAALEWIDKQIHQFQLERQELRDAKELRIEEAEDRNDQRALRAAKGIRINTDELERKQVGFAWVDGVFWERWIRTTYGIDVKDGEKVIINDEDVGFLLPLKNCNSRLIIMQNHRYWDTTITGEPIRPSRTYILETISKVISNPPKIPSKSSTGTIESFFRNTRQFIGHHPWLSLGMAIGFVLAALLGRSRMRRRTVGYFHLEGKESLLGGMNGVGKKD
ncbi:thioredoxin-like protein [Lojkania enalia]|uniref:Thioredoxin-like protein n=1 Tax=Lojkania enalia TaxID=147567 RepID=A0A9P4K3M8_9PLEO|nr:thioredoxin-like protein [Didymosphaeria enalia]